MVLVNICFVLRERARESACKSRGQGCRGWGRERIFSRFHTQCGAWSEAWPTSLGSKSRVWCSADWTPQAPLVLLNIWRKQLLARAFMIGEPYKVVQGNSQDETVMVGGGQRIWVPPGSKLTLVFWIFIYLFGERERERERESTWERGRERISSRLHAISAEPDRGLKPTNPKIMTWAEIKSQTLNWLSHPGVPTQLNFAFVLLIMFTFLNLSPLHIALWLTHCYRNSRCSNI